MIDRSVKKRKLKPIEVCPNGHYYNAYKTGEVCGVCGDTLDYTKDLMVVEQKELAHIDEKDWVCGWIVCIKGLNKGRGYEIKNGKNFIGRSSGMDIQVIGDMQIEKKNHAMIMYDSKSRETHLIPGGSRGLVYLEGEVIFHPCILDPYSKIELGESIFIFVQFCRKEFDWEDTNEDIPLHNS